MKMDDGMQVELTQKIHNPGGRTAAVPFTGIQDVLEHRKGNQGKNHNEHYTDIEIRTGSLFTSSRHQLHKPDGKPDAYGRRYQHKNGQLLVHIAELRMLSGTNQGFPEFMQRIISSGGLLDMLKKYKTR